MILYDLFNKLPKPISRKIQVQEKKPNISTMYESNKIYLVGNTGSMWKAETELYSTIAVLCCNPFEVKISQARIFTEKIPKEIL